MKKSMFGALALMLGIGGGNSNTVEIRPLYREPAPRKQRMRAMAASRWREDNPIHTNANAAARRLRQIQRGMLKPESRNITALAT